MSYYGRSHFNVSTLAFRQLVVAPGAQIMLYATWGWSIHPDRRLIVEAAVRHLLEPQKLTRIFEDPLCGDFFVLCRTAHEADMLYRNNVNVDGDVVIFTAVHYLWVWGSNEPIQYLSNCTSLPH